jgi:hypothetical protein
MTNQDTRRAVQQIILQCEGGAPTEADAPSGASVSSNHKLLPCQNFDSASWYTCLLNETAFGWQHCIRLLRGVAILRWNRT